MQQDHQDGGIQGLLAIDGQLLQAFHLLGFLDHHQLALRHHGEAAGGGDDGFRIHVPAVADGLVEIFLPLLETVVDDFLTEEVRIIGLLPHQ